MFIHYLPMRYDYLEIVNLFELNQQYIFMLCQLEHDDYQVSMWIEA